jgi:hypothetical protein
MKHLKLTLVGLLAFTAAASDAFAQGSPPNSVGGGPGDAASGAAGISGQQWNICSDVCVTGDAQSQQTCWTGCVNRYRYCKVASDCR